MSKVAIICSPGMDNHLGEIKDYFCENHETKICVNDNQEEIFNSLKWADIVWIEWADQTAINVSNLERLLFGKQVILRLHSYEAFTQYLNYIKWSSITDLIFIADHIKDIVLEKYPTIKSNVDRMYVIPNGIDENRFKQRKRKNKKDLAYLGFLNFKKDPVLLFTAFTELLKIDPEYKLHIAGAFQEERYELYLKQMQKENPLLKKQIIFHGWVEKPEEWLKDKSHIVCTSVLESQGKGIMEAMAMGIKPVVHNFVGAKKIYPAKYIWNTAQEFCKMILMGKYKPSEYRNFILQNYRTKDIKKQIDKLTKKHNKILTLFTKRDNIKPIKLSISMIMKDEEKHIGRCLESVKDIADEIIIVDTGSTDNSIEIAESYGAKIYNHPWENNFSTHRNQAIKYSTGDWLLQIDADEELIGNKQGLKDTLARINNGYNGVSINLRDVCQESGTQFNASRIFRNGKIKYKRAVHNIPVYDGARKHGSVLFGDATIIHHGSHYQISKEESEKKAKRTGNLLLSSLKEDPNDYELLFYLSQLKGTIGDYESAINYAEQYLANKNKCDGFNNSVYYSIIRLYMEVNDFEKANYWLREAHIILPTDLDIAFVTVELGVKTGNGQLLLQGARNYVRQYEIFNKNPESKGGRFIFSLKPDSLFFVLKHMTAYLLGDGVNCLDQLKASIGTLPKKYIKTAIEEVNQLLNPIGISTN